MDSTAPLLKVDKACDDAILWATRRLEESGLQAVRTFDLQVARQSHLDCACPHHGTEKCDCRMVVILISKGKRGPATILIHSYDQASLFYLVNTPQQPVEHHLEKTIQDVLSLDVDQSVAPIVPV